MTLKLARSKEEWDHLWTCGECYVDCLSPRCHECRKPRHLIDRAILESREEGETTTRRWVLIEAADRPEVPSCAVVKRTCGSRGQYGSVYLSVAKFPCDKSAAEFCRLSPDTTRRFRTGRRAADVAEEENDRRFFGGRM